MKEILDKFGLTEFLAHLSPGAIALSSLSLWIEPRLLQAAWEAAAKNTVLATTVLTLFAYILGLTLGMIAVAGEERYGATAIPDFKTVFRSRADFLRFLQWFVLWMFHGYPKLPPTTRANDALIQARLDIHDALETFPVKPVIDLVPYGSDQLLLYRVIYAEKFKGQGIPILEESQGVQRRVLFALGVAQSLLLWAFMAFARLLSFGLTHLPAPAFLRHLIPVVQWCALTASLLLAMGAVWMLFAKGRWTLSLAGGSAVMVSVALLTASRDYLYELPPYLIWPTLVLLIGIMVFGSFRLRKVANRWRQHELILTYSLLGL